MTLAPHLVQTLDCIINGSGDDIYFILGYLNDSTARSYVSKLKRKGLAYTYISGGTTEVWPTPKGIEFIKNYNKSPS